MTLLPDLAYFVGGVAFINAIPHLVSGLQGRAFQSPFAKPPGEGLSSSTVNVLWGFLNLAIAYVLVLRVGAFDLRSIENAVALAIGALLASVMLARSFGRFHGGSTS